ncbi:hypothetical protein PV08_07805 [Exophiala spinifera]|uniref:Glycosyltransferase family 8 protein n=1 Tax=Exophiala spinifera TaxID=91928 RepID=A0A0D2B831_9EURO|nr:uncharacterized protein PV08_07805 [Exophiala spinifera]KIW15018.1 hypothetical protein PV08_07805 [Exophiala spinifera]
MLHFRRSRKPTIIICLLVFVGFIIVLSHSNGAQLDATASLVGWEGPQFSLPSWISTDALNFYKNNPLGSRTGFSASSDPQEAPLKPENDTPSPSEETPVEIPEDTPATTSDETEIVPLDAPELTPEVTEDVPEEIPATAPEVTDDIPKETPATTPEVTEDVPEEIPAASDETEKVPEETEMVPEVTPEENPAAIPETVPEDTPAPLDQTSDETSESAETTDKTPKPLEEVPAAIPGATPEDEATPAAAVVASTTDAEPTAATEAAALESLDSAFTKGKMSFQNDLDITLPKTDLTQFAKYRPHNYEPLGPDEDNSFNYAYATFLSTRNPSLRDPYFLAVQSLIYRVLWSERSKSDQYPFIAFVAEYIPEPQRDILRGLGAEVRELAPVVWHPNVEGVHARWADLFAKLHMWNETEFEKILFIDADAFPVTNVDEMFELAPWQECNRTLLELDDVFPDITDSCEPYALAGVPMDVSPADGVSYNWNVGSMVISPSPVMHRRLLQNYVKADHFDNHMAEQAFLNWQFRVNGPFPPTLLNRTYDGFLPQPHEEGQFKIIHEKLWAFDKDGWLGREWSEPWQWMVDWIDGGLFAEARENDGLRKTKPVTGTLPTAATAGVEK